MNAANLALDLALTQGVALKNAVVIICGNLFIAVMVIKALRLSWDEDFNKKLAFLGSAGFCAIFIWVPESAKTVVTDLAKTIVS
ncbi:hypothetical protein [Streptomyces sp. NBC_01264]|uniref:hypothetical protein n=1 Tax=Streptomyces sp. NBC_01264 TaxID=2903804 RepID=UPI00225631E4|nr:hypothetical protein [Streptomyces sp. NBC_01264]MCX4784632.1 hypothetical protein [Streptomyces sp. NBC_01264]